MAIARSSKIKLVVLDANGVRIKLPLSEAAGFELQAGMKVSLVHEGTGRAVQGVTAKRVGPMLQIESPELEQPLVLKDSGQLGEFHLADFDASAVTNLSQGAGFVDNYAAADAGGKVASDAGAAGSASGATAATTGVLAGVSGTALLGGLGLLALAGGGGGGGAAAVIASAATGTAIDGYLQGATVTRLNGSGNSVTTDANGRYTGLTGTGAIKVVGGIDKSTGLEFKGTLTAPDGATVVTPVTTLIASIAGTSASAADIQAATQKVLTLLGVNTSFDVLKSDPIALAQTDATALEAYQAGVMVATTLQVIAGGNATQFQAAANALVSVLNTANTAVVGTGATLLTNTLSTVVSTYQTSTGTTVDAADVALLSNAIKNIDGATSVSQVASQQAGTLYDTLNATPTATAGATFTATVNATAKTITFGGTALGPITIDIAADGSATFTRAGVKAAADPVPTCPTSIRWTPGRARR